MTPSMRYRPDAYVLPVSRRRPARQDRRSLAAVRPRHRRCAGLLPQGARLDAAPRAAQGHARRPCAQSSRAVAAAARASVLAQREGSDEPVSQQPRRAGSSGGQATILGDAWAKVLRRLVDHAGWRRACPSHSQAPVHARSCTWSATSYNALRVGPGTVRRMTHFSHHSAEPWSDVRCRNRSSMLIMPATAKQRLPACHYLPQITSFCWSRRARRASYLRDRHACCA